MATNQSAQTVKNFSGLKTLEAVTAQLDLVLGRMGDILDSRSQTISLLDPKSAAPTMKAGDFVLDYTAGKVVPGMSDGKNVQPLSLDVFTGVISTAQHGMLDSQLLDDDGNVVGDLHQLATGASSGFMSSTDKSRFNGMTPGGTPPSLDASAGTDGVATTYSRSDHVHQIAVGTPVTLSTVNAAGTSNNLARADHTHSHGSQTSGTHHAVATTSTAGFMAAADKVELNRFGGYDPTSVTMDGSFYLIVTQGGVTKRFGPGVP